MEQTAQETGANGTTHTIGRVRTSALGGLSRPVLMTVVVVVAAVVGLGSLAQAGVLAPQFRNTGGGSGEPNLPAGASHVGFQVLQNVSWRSWTITSVETTEPAGGDVLAFVLPADAPGSLPDQIESSAGDPARTRLPLTVPAGDELVVVQYQRPPACAGQPAASAGPVQTDAALGIASPLGRRWIRTILFHGAPAPGTGDSCAVTR